MVAELTLAADKRSRVPLYFQLAQQLQDAITTGVLMPGDRLDNEVHLAERLNLSRPTIRRAIQELVERGLVVRKRGVGTQVVSGPTFSRPVRLTSLHRDLTEANMAPTTQVLANRTITAPDDIALRFDLPPRAQVRYLRRLRFVGGHPLAVMENYLPASLISPSDEDLSTSGLYDLLRIVGQSPKVAHQRIGARTITLEERQLLNEASGSPVLTMERLTFNDSGDPIEWGRHAYRPALHDFTVTVTHL